MKEVFNGTGFVAANVTRLYRIVADSPEDLKKKMVGHISTEYGADQDPISADIEGWDGQRVLETTAGADEWIVGPTPRAQQFGMHHGYDVSKFDEEK